MQGILLRLYRDADGGAVRALFRSVNRELAPSDMVETFECYIALAEREEITRISEYYGTGRGRGFWVAEDANGDIIGMFGLEPAGDDAAELRRMYVASAARGRGVASAMLREAERFVRASGLKRLVLSTSELQPAALALYRGAGYRLVREEVASAANNKTIGSGVRRFYFEKQLREPAVERG